MDRTAFRPDAAWRLRLQTSPLAALEDCRAAFQTGEVSRNLRLYRAIAAVVLFVDVLAASPANERAFRAHAFWRGSRRVLKTRRLSLLAVRYVLGADEAKGTLYEQARSYALVVEHYRQAGFNPDQIVAELQGRGIYRLLDSLGGDGESQDAGSRDGGPDGGDSAGHEAEDDTSSASGEASASSDEDGETDEGEGANDTPSEVGGRAWWAAFLAHAKEVYAGGRVPIIVAGHWSDLDDLQRRSRHRDAVLTVSQAEPTDRWSAFVCRRVERTRDSARARRVQAAARPMRLFPPAPPAGGGAERAVEAVALRALVESAPGGTPDRQQDRTPAPHAPTSAQIVADLVAPSQRHDPTSAHGEEADRS